MKKIFTLLLLSITTLGFSQGELHFEGQPIGPTLSIDSAVSSIDHFQADLYIVNTGSTPLEIRFSRTRKYHKNGWTDQICDATICFNADDIKSWSRPNNPPLTIPVGDSSIFQVKVKPHGIDGCSIYSYKVEAQNHMFIDSIDVTYTIGGINCFLSDNEIITALAVSVYPNPANNVLNISISENNTSISIFDIVGKNVSEMNLVNGKNTLNIENLNPGVYFYSIKRNGNIIETKKLIVK